MKPNILFLCIDAFRADRCYGKEKTSKTPNIDFLIKQGAYFNSAFSSSDGTPVSFTSMFTGYYPHKSCVRKGRWNFEVNKKITAYPTLLQNNGYHCYATMPELLVIKDFFSFFENKDKTYPLFGFRLYDGLGKQILDKLNSNELKEPWFYFVHLMDAHKPISYPKEFEKDEFGMDDYDRMISSIDVWIGKIIEKLDLEKTIVILTADHGDYLRVINFNGKRLSFEYKSFAKPALKAKNSPRFLRRTIKYKIMFPLRDIITRIKLMRVSKKLTPYEKRSLFHARSFSDRYLFDELFHVPLILCGYGIPKGKIIQQQIGTIDIFPTITGILKIKNENTPHGRNLIPILLGEEFEETPLYIESGFNLQDSSKAIMGIRTSKYKYFRSMFNTNKNVNLYDLSNDPLEEINIADIQKDLVNEMEKKLLDINDISEFRASEEIEDEENKKVEEQLRKLGYLE